MRWRAGHTTAGSGLCAGNPDPTAIGIVGTPAIAGPELTEMPIGVNVLLGIKLHSVGLDEASVTGEPQIVCISAAVIREHWAVPSPPEP